MRLWRGGWPGVALAVSVAVVLVSGVANASSLDAPRGQTTAYGGNPSRTGVVADPQVFGPLATGWARRFKGPVGQPLVTRRRVLVSVADSNGKGYGTSIVSLNPKTGSTQWKARTPGTYYTAPIAVGQGVVVSINYNGDARAFSVRNGKRLWAHEAGAGSVLIDDGVAYVSGTAYELRTGNRLWSVSSGNVGVDGPAAIDAKRLYMGSTCGAAVAYSRATGELIWQKRGGSSQGNCEGRGPVVSHGVLYSGSGRTYDAATGDRRRRLRKTPEAVARGIGLVAGFRAIAAFRLPKGNRAWRGRGGESEVYAKPLIVGSTAYIARDSFLNLPASLIGYGVKSGRILSLTRIADGGYVSVGGTIPGIGAGGGRLFVGQGTAVTMLRPRLDPKPDGLDITALDAIAGSRTIVEAGLGKKVRKSGSKVRFRSDGFPFGRLSGAGAARTRENGVAAKRVKLRRNTRLQARTKGAKTRIVTAFAYPRIRLTLASAGAGHGRAKVRVKGLPRSVARGRRTFLYFSQRGGSRFKRKASGPLRAGRGGRSSARIRFAVPRQISKKTIVTACVERLPRAGFGRDTDLYGACGRRVVDLHGKGSARIAPGSAGGEGLDLGLSAPHQVTEAAPLGR